MPFAHFHRHSRKYLAFFLVATLFSLLTFSITPALTSFANSLFGGTTGSFVVFKTSSGRMVGIDDVAWQSAVVELPYSASIFMETKNYDPYSGLHNKEDLVLAHEVMLAEAGEMKVEVPAERADQLLVEFKAGIQERLQRSQQVLTKSMWSAELRRAGLTEERLRHRLLEILKVEAYVRAVRGVRIHDPERMLQIFANGNALVGLEWVALPFEKFAAEMKASPPADEELEKWFAALPKETIEDKYTAGQKYSIDVALVDADAWDPAKVAAELLPPAEEPTDDEVLRTVKGDVKRFRGKDGVAPAAIADVTAEERARVRKDRQLEKLLGKARLEFDAAVAALPVLDASKPDEERKAALAERVAKEKELFAQAAAKYGLEVKSFADQEDSNLDDLDPPKDASLQFIVRGLRVPGAVSSEQRAQVVLAAGERKWAYVVRVADEPKPRAPRPFAEVKEKILEQWIDEHAKDAAVAKGEALRDALVAEAEKDPALTETTKTAFRADRDETQKALEGKLPKDATDAAKKLARTKAVDEHFYNLQAALHSTVGARFGEVAKALGLEVASAAPQRKNVGSGSYFNDLHSGAERFLFRSPPDANNHSLLGFGEGAVSGVLVDEAGKAAYVVHVVSRQVPGADQMTPQDLEETESAEEFEWQRSDNLMFRRMPGYALETPPYDNPFSIAQIVRRHEPQMRVSRRGSAAPPSNYYGYN
jgi:hypothetical protein